MTTTLHARAHAGAAAHVEERNRPRTAYPATDLTKLPPYMLMLMMRNVTSDGFVIQDSADRFSLPGCVIAAPSYPANTPGIDQDYVYNWVRDAAITMLEVAEAGLPVTPGDGLDTLNDYARFVQICQNNAQPTLAHACFTVNGLSRPWSEQSDGPALQTIALLRAYSQLDADAQNIAQQVIARNLDFLLGAYQGPTTSPWEEHFGLSFFARSVQLRCFQELKISGLVQASKKIDEAIEWLTAALGHHWNGQYYLTLLASDSTGQNYDPNIDIVSACVYGAVPCTDTRLLATAAMLRGQWADNGSWQYAINRDDQARGIGPMLGRYPGDLYDGDVSDQVQGGHPWALCTCNFAELYYRLAAEIAASGAVPLDDLSKPFFAQVGIDRSTPVTDAVNALRDAGDAMMRAVVFHSDHYELSEQFDAVTGYEKSVRNLTWSYAAFLSASRARTVLVQAQAQLAGVP